MIYSFSQSASSFPSALSFISLRKNEKKSWYDHSKNSGTNLNYKYDLENISIILLFKKKTAPFVSESKKKLNQQFLSPHKQYLNAPKV